MTSLVQIGKKDRPGGANTGSDARADAGADAGRLGSGKPPHAQSEDAPKLYLETYGCQMNVADSDMITGLLGESGYVAASGADDADVIVINTCAVREKAEERVFARAKELSAQKRKRRGVVLAVVGCMAEHLKERLAEAAPHVDVIAGPDSYRRLPDMLRARREHSDSQAKPSIAATIPATIDVKLDKKETYVGVTRQGAQQGTHGVSGFVTIQRGCDKFCTFCVVPFTRGRERGVPPREILSQVRALVDSGAKEVTLLGQTVNSYRFEDVTFAELLRTVATVPGLERIRFTSPYPVDFSDEVIDVIAHEPKVCLYVHLPIQSGSDVVLERMRRGYSIDDFRLIVSKLRKLAPKIAFSTDILSGFCGETEADHQQTLELMRELRFDSAFMFSYSERDLTFAAKSLTDDISPEIKKRRLKEIIALQESISGEVFASRVGRVERILIHSPSKRDPNQMVGRTDDFKSVIVTGVEEGTKRSADLSPGDLVDVRIERATMATLFGSLVDSVVD